MNCGKLSRRYIIVTDVGDEAGKRSARDAIYHSRVRADSAGPSDRMAFLLRHAAETTRHRVGNYHWEARLKSHKPSNTIAPAVHHYLSH